MLNSLIPFISNNIMNKIETIKIVDCFDFLEHDLTPRGKYHYLLDRFVFRGEARSDYSLLPSILRKETRSKCLSSPFNEWSNKDTQSTQLHLELKILRRFFSYPTNEVYCSQVVEYWNVMILRLMKLLVTKNLVSICL